MWKVSLTILFVVLFILFGIFLLSKPNRNPIKTIPLAVGIPCCWKHIRLLKECIEGINRQTYVPIIIIISISEIPYDKEVPMIESGIPIVVLESHDKQNASINRNKCIEYIVNNCEITLGYQKYLLLW